MTPRNGASIADKQGLSPKRPHRETPDVAEGVCRMVRAIGRRVAVEDTDGLEQLKALEAALNDAWAIAVTGLRRTYSDREIGEMLGMTRQAVWQRWPREKGATA